jgi:hypothetical protein
MATLIAVWHRESRSFIGAPMLLFNSSADADLQIARAQNQDKRKTKAGTYGTYDKISLTVP